MSPGTVSPLSNVKGLAFDVFGTVVDWRTSVTEEFTLRAFRKQSSNLKPDVRARLEILTEADWGRLAQEWHNSYIAFCRSFDPATHAWKPIGEHHRDSLTELLQKWDLTDVFTESEVESISLVWHRLSPWPDSSAGLQKLGDGGAKYITSTLSNGNVALLRDLDDFGALGFGKLLSAETFQAYKPHPTVYLGAAREMGLEPGQLAMVAAHLGDLQAARDCGLRTIYVERPREEAWGKDEERYKEARNWVDLWISQEEEGFLTLANRLSQVE